MDKQLSYFKANPAFKRIFDAMLKQWKAYGRCAGTIKLLNATPDELEAIGSVIGKVFDGNDISFKFSEFENALPATSSGNQMLYLLEAYYGHAIMTNKEVTRIKNEKIIAFFQQLQAELIEKLEDAREALTYLTQMQEKKDSLYPLILHEYKKSQEETIAMFTHAWIGVEQLRKERRIRLAVLSTKVSGYPHYFDRNMVSGKFLLYVLSYINQMEYPKNAEEIANLYDKSHILPDDISNFTTAYGVHLYCEGEPHKAYEAFIKQKEPYIVTLSNLNRIDSAKSISRNVYIVENQMLFSQLCEELAAYDVTILCTSGQLKLASLILVDLLCQSKCNIYYAGDFDPEGILIADRMIARNPKLIHPWFYQIADYKKSISKECLSVERLNQLHDIRNEALRLIADAMLDKKRAGYQEALLADMVKELKTNHISM